MPDLLDRPLDSFSWSARIANAFRNNDLVTVRDLVTKTEMEILRFDNFGRKSLNEVKEWLCGQGLRLGMDFGPACLTERDRRLLEKGTLKLCLQTVRDNVEAMLAIQRSAHFNRKEDFEHHRAVVLARMDEIEYAVAGWANDRGGDIWS